MIAGGSVGCRAGKILPGKARRRADTGPAARPPALAAWRR